MRKKLKLLIISIVTIAIVFLGYEVFSKIHYKNQVSENIRSIPQFEVEDMKGNVFNDKMVLDKPIVLIYFNSECHYCQNEAEHIKNSVDKFKKFQLLFISTEPKAIIQNFSNKYGLSNYDNIYFLHDSRDTIATVFDINQIPGILVYDANKVLKNSFKGQVHVDTLLTYLDM